MASSRLKANFYGLGLGIGFEGPGIGLVLDLDPNLTNADKTELLWVGSRHSFSQQDGCLLVLQLGSDSIVARDHVRLLGVTLSSDLSFDRHVSIVSASSFYWLRQLQRSRRSLDTESAATLVHSFVASRIDYYKAVLSSHT